ncbi:hypothetical protein [Burkholderia sp. GbtcB21]|uniref:hypothetical protein n=1 Tax=Burkholderia sp. GbtcB21 TaxID=2824766 RepID=UPI001C2F23AC|nr:hypothetical protein [Burkholderia sp. GbtcB21]
MLDYAIEPIHNELAFPVASFRVSVDELRDILGDSASAVESMKGPGWTMFDSAEFANLNSFLKNFVEFEPRFFGVSIFERDDRRPPYLIHTGFEAPLFINGKKKLGWLDLSPGMSLFEKFRMECLERLVNQGELEKYDRTIIDGDGARGRIFYSSPGEGWRVKTYEVLQKVSATTGGWNSGYEEMLGALMGYSDDENRWWILDCMSRDIFPSGMRFYCALESEDLEFVRNGGNKILPWRARDPIILHWGVSESDEFYKSMIAEAPKKTGVVRIVASLSEVKAIAIEIGSQVYKINFKSIPELNKIIRGEIKIVHERL